LWNRPSEQQAGKSGVRFFQAELDFLVVHSVLTRVTRFDEFSPNEQLFTLSSFFKRTKVDQMLGLLLSMEK
jgi:hypothetical protein